MNDQELSEQELENIFRDYLAAGRSVYLPELLDQGNSKRWEKDVEEYRKRLCLPSSSEGTNSAIYLVYQN
jgi:hypothetical protein